MSETEKKAEEKRQFDSQLATIKTGNTGLQMNTVADMQTVCRIIVASKLAPDSFDTEAKVFVALQTGSELGLRPMQSLASLYVYKGMATLYGDAALAMVLKSGLCDEYNETLEGVGENMIAKVKSISNRNGVKRTVESEFSVADAKTACLWTKSGTWKTHPKRMLKYKSRAFNLRDNFPDVLMGMHLTEEMVGEEQVPFEEPQCATKPRADRRKPVEAAVITDTPTEQEPEQEATVTELEPAVDTEGITDEDAAGTVQGPVESGMAQLRFAVWDKLELPDGSDLPQETINAIAAVYLCKEVEEIEDGMEPFEIENVIRYVETEGIPESCK